MTRTHVNSRKMLESSVLVVSMSNGVVESLFESSKLAISGVHFFLLKSEKKTEKAFCQNNAQVLVGVRPEH